MDLFLSNKTKPQAVFWVISNKIKLDEVKWPPSPNQQSEIERPPKIPKLETNQCFDWLKLKKSPVKSTPGPKKKHASNAVFGGWIFRGPMGDL